MGKKLTILNILIPTFFFLTEAIVALMNYPEIFIKSKWDVIGAFLGVVIYFFLWIFIQSSKFSKNGGLIIGLLFIINISTEEFVHWQTKTSSLLSTLIPMFLIFISFGIIAGYKTFHSKRISTGIQASLVSALLGTIIALCFGFLINYLFPNLMETGLKNYPGYNDFRNPRAFIFYNSFDNATNHLLSVPIVSIIFGSIGAVLGLLLRKHKKIENIDL